MQLFLDSVVASWSTIGQLELSKLNMDRRKFSKVAIATSLASPFVAHAQERPVAGKHYSSVSPRQPTRDPKQIEVVEFFAYSCEHCFMFEPALEAWHKRLPAGVVLRRVPIAFRESFATHQKLFFAIEQLGLVDQLHGKVFTAIHMGKQRLDKPEGIAEFAKKNGVEPSRLVDAANSFAVAAKAKQANALATGYGVQGTPSLGVDGRWLTSGSMTGSNEQALAVAEFLIGEARRAVKT